MAGADLLSSQYKYISMQRLTDFIEQSMFQSLQWVVFEPNDASTSAKVRTAVGSFMADLFAEGAFVGATPEQAFFVQCDRTTTPLTDIAAGIMNVVVGFAPLSPAEFVVLNFAQRTAQASG